METPVQIVFRNMDRSDAVEANIRERVQRLERFFDRIVSCTITVEAAHRRHHKGNLYSVKVDIGVPGKEIVVNRTGPKDHAHEDVYVAVRDAFAAATRRLEEYARAKRGAVKHHEAPAGGRVTRLFPAQGYGFITMPDGQEIYFHENSVVNSGFAQLSQNDEVRVVLAPDDGDKGPQASTVQPVGKHHIVQ